ARRGGQRRRCGQGGRGRLQLDRGRQGLAREGLPPRQRRGRGAPGGEVALGALGAGLSQPPHARQRHAPAAAEPSAASVRDRATPARGEQRGRLGRHGQRRHRQHRQRRHAAQPDGLAEVAGAGEAPGRVDLGAAVAPAAGTAAGRAAAAAAAAAAGGAAAAAAGGAALAAAAAGAAAFAAAAAAPAAVALTARGGRRWPLGRWVPIQLFFLQRDAMAHAEFARRYAFYLRTDHLAQPFLIAG
ncbi:unnamed protein product, partial [Prorocentrum cordatum]